MSDKDEINMEISNKEIYESLAEIKTEIKHLSHRMDTRVTEIETLKTELGNLKIQLAVNDKQTSKNTDWFDYLIKMAIICLLGYMAVKVGLK